MTRGHLNERYVQEITVEWLASHYQDKLNAKAAVPTLEACIKKSSKRGYGRADGLIALQMNDGAIYTVSVEAKSSRTRHHINLDSRKDIKLLWHSLVFASAILLFIVLLGMTASGGLFFGLILPILVFLGVGLGFVLLATNLDYYQPSSVIKQAKRYPANEKWIALSADVYNTLDKRGQITNFVSECRRNGIGLIKASPRSKILILVEPLKINTPKNVGSFLECYTKEKIIQTALAQAIVERETIASTIILEEPEQSIEQLSPAILEIID